MPLDRQNSPEGHVFRSENVRSIVSCMELPRSKLAAIDPHHVAPVSTSPPNFSTFPPYHKDERPTSSVSATRKPRHFEATNRTKASSQEKRKGGSCRLVVDTAGAFCRNTSTDPSVPRAVRAAIHDLRDPRYIPTSEQRQSQGHL